MVRNKRLFYTFLLAFLLIFSCLLSCKPPIVETPEPPKLQAPKLASLAIDGFELVPVFSPSTLEYSLSANLKVQSVVIAASTDSVGAVISGTGSKNLAIGKNTLGISVSLAGEVHKLRDNGVA